MAKYYNNQKKTGKVAGSVFAIRYGETIERAYNPVVSNPNTDAQVEARAKLKLMSQLGAVLGGVIAMPRIGAKSSRNLFVSKNYHLATYAQDEASVQMEQIQLTQSAVALPAVVSVRSEQTINVSIDATTGTDLSRVIYVLVVRGSDEKLRVVDTAVVTAPGANDRWSHSFATIPEGGYVYAYGIRDNNDRARAIFSDITAPTAQQIAKLVVTRTLLESDVTLTETRGDFFNAAQA